MKILLAAFEPFGGDKINSALEAVKLVDVDKIDAKIIKLEVPTVFGRSIDLIRETILREKPDIVLAIGQAGGRCALTPERVAINVDDARMKDNAGSRPIDRPIVNEGPAAYFTTLPIKAIVRALQAAGLPAQISNSAGTFVCNHLMYGMMHTLACELPKSRGGFMHVPFIPDQVVSQKDQPSMSLANITRGIELALNAILDQEENSVIADSDRA